MSIRSRHRRLVLASVVLLPLACVSSSPTPQGLQALDGGPDYDAHVDFDAAALPDGTLPVPPPPPPADGGDAAVDAAPAVTTVTVLGAGGAPKAGVPVIFQDAAGAIVEAQTTNALGQAARTIVDGSMVTVATGGAGQRELVTFVGLKNGVQILAFDVAPQVASSTLSVTVPGSPPAGTFQYQVLSGDCASAFGRPPIVDYISPECQSKGNAPVVAYAYNDAQQLVGWSYGKTNPLATDGGAAPGAATSAWSTTFGVFHVAVTNAPAGLARLTVENAEMAAGVPLHTQSTIAMTEGAGTAPLRTLPGYADTFQPQVSVAGRGGPNLRTTSIFAKAIAPPANDATVTFDLAQLLPTFTATSTDSSDPAHPKLAWTFGGPATDAVGGVARVAWSAQTDAGFEPRGWTFVVPTGTVSVQGPKLPAALAEWVPAAQTYIGVPDIVFLAEDDVPTYEAFLARYAGFSGLALPVLPPNVTLRAVAATNGG